jgi:hypothetical protein
MSAKARAISITGQQTPVIIKVGGDAAGLYNDQSNVQSPVSIDSPVMTFRENIPGPTWKRAESTRKGRLRELTIVNGDEQQDFPITPDSQLASITLQYGLDELVIREIGDAHNNNVSLEFVSDQVPFTATREPDWNDASATFPQAVTGVVFKQGETVVVQQRYRVPNIRLTFSIDYRRNEPQ